MSMKLFRRLLLSLRKASAEGFQFAALQMICDVKVDLRRKYRLVIEGHIFHSPGHKVYATITNSVSARILMTLSEESNIDVMMGDIGNAYFNANTQTNIYKLYRH